jgi:hypothetical protein
MGAATDRRYVAGSLPDHQFEQWIIQRTGRLKAKNRRTFTAPHLRGFSFGGTAITRRDFHQPPYRKGENDDQTTKSR